MYTKIKELNFKIKQKTTTTTMSVAIQSSHLKCRIVSDVIDMIDDKTCIGEHNNLIEYALDVFWTANYKETNQYRRSKMWLKRLLPFFKNMVAVLSAGSNSDATVEKINLIIRTFHLVVSKPGHFSSVKSANSHFIVQLAMKL